MANRPALLKQSDLTRYANGLQKAGVADWRIEVHPNGTHTIIAGRVETSAAGPDPDPDELLK